MELAEYIQAIQHVRLDWLRDHLPKLDDLAAIALLELSIGYHLAIPGMEEWLIRQLSDIPIVQSMHPGDWEGQAPSLPTMEEELARCQDVDLDDDIARREALGKLITLDHPRARELYQEYSCYPSTRRLNERPGVPVIYKDVRLLYTAIQVGYQIPLIEKTLREYDEYVWEDLFDGSDHGTDFLIIGEEQSKAHSRCSGEFPG